MLWWASHASRWEQYGAQGTCPRQRASRDRCIRLLIASSTSCATHLQPLLEVGRVCRTKSDVFVAIRRQHGDAIVAQSSRDVQSLLVGGGRYRATSRAGGNGKSPALARSAGLSVAPPGLEPGLF